MKTLTMVLMLLLVTTAALAQAATGTVTSTAALGDPGAMPDQLSWMVNAFKSGDWMTFSGVLLAVVVSGFKLVGLNKLIPKTANKWVAGGIATATSLSVGLVVHASWWVIISTAVGTFFTAVGGYQVVIEPVSKWIKKKLGGGEKAAPPKEEEKADA